MTADDEDEDELDTAFELLADRRRRAVVEILRAAPRGVVDFSELVDAVATDGDGDEPETLASTLYHRHLPKLDDAGVVEFDPEEGVVSYDSHPLVERCLDVAQSYRSDRWVRRSSESD